MKTPFNPVTWFTWLTMMSNVARARLSTTGNITLFYGTTCETAVFANSAILGADVCSHGRSDLPPEAFDSFVLNERPFCVNGSRPYFNLYSDAACGLLARSYPAGPLYNPTGPDADGTCVVPSGGFYAMAFICDGLPGGVPTSTLGTSASVVVSTSLGSTSREQSASSTDGTSTVLGSTTSPASTSSGAASTSRSSATATIPSATTTSSAAASTAGAALAVGRSGSMISFILPLVVLMA